MIKVLKAIFQSDKEIEFYKKVKIFAIKKNMSQQKVVINSLIEYMKK